VRRIVLTGSECTGKTTTAAAVAARLGVPWVPESARTYAEAKGAPLTDADVSPIARAHVEAVERAERIAGGLVILDTDLISTVVYARHYYGRCPAWIERAARARRAALYLLLAPDLPWQADPSRDRGNRRGEMHALFGAALREFDATSVEIAGPGPARVERALAAILAAGPPA
jgi:NadR type nicotinamide-nucleotide adenylyltransferase